MTNALAGRGETDLSKLRSPFKGLASFEVQDSPLFYGRRMERRLCLANLRSNRITVLYAPSGVGKTSLLAAGVVPDVRYRAVRDDDPVPSQSVILLNTWNDDPLGHLEVLIDEAMRAASVPSEECPGLGIESRLVRWTQWMRGPVLIVLDQFERLYTGRRLSAEQIDRFVEKLALMIDRSDLAVNVMLAVREDSLAVLDHLGDYVPEAKRNWLSLGELTQDGAREAIEGPIAWWKENRPSEPCPAVEDGFVENVLHSCVSRRRGSHKSAAEQRYDAPLLQMMLKRRWDEAVRMQAKLIAIPFTEQNRETILTEVVRERLRKIPVDLEKTAAIVFTHLISAAQRPLPQSCAELVSRGDRDGRPLDSVHVQEVLDLLSTGEREIRILQEIPGDPSPLYTILQDFLVKPVLTWATDWLRAEERYLREGIWPRIREHLPTLSAILFGVAFLGFAWLWGEARLHDKAVHIFPNRVKQIRTLNEVLSVTEGHYEEDARLIAVPEGALFWALWRPESFTQRNAPGEAHGDDPVWSGTYIRVWPLMRSGPEQRYVGKTVIGEERWKICVRDFRSNPADESCANLDGAQPNDAVGLQIGGERVFSYRDDGRVVLYSKQGTAAAPLNLKPKAGFRNHLVSASVMCDASNKELPSAIVILEKGDRDYSVVHLFNCQGAEINSFPAKGSHIALLPGRPRTVRELLSGNRKLRIAIADSKDIRTYSLAGKELGKYPENDDERMIQFLWPVAR